MSLTAQRTDLKVALETIPAIAATVTVYDYVPESLSAPAIIIQPGDPYLTDAGQTHNTYKVGRLLTILTESNANDRATDELDTMIEAVIDAIDVSEVSAPYPFTYNTATYLAVNATVTDTLKIGI